MVWFDGQHAVSYTRQQKFSPVVEVALDMFNSDMKAVTGRKIENSGKGIIQIYQLDQLTNKEFKKLNKQRLPYQKIIAQKDAFYIGVHEGHIVIIGSNGRGTAYGILELSRLAGVSPWIWWGDVIPERQERLVMSEKFKTIQMPSVEWRGIFINDEDWSLRAWAHERMDTRLRKGDIGPRTYKKIFELLLRLRANMIWPAMHEGTTPFFKVKGNREVADSCAIIIGSSHCEPILRNNVGEWNENRMGEFNFMTNRQRVMNYWGERAQETRGMEAIYTLGMRGIHDGSMLGVKTMEEKVNGLQQVINEQRKMLAEVVNSDLNQVPQVFIPYKEVLDIYENGLRVPDDVTLLWCDDNYGYLTRLPDEQQQQRKGGSGIYYHLSYWGQPHDYLWLSTTQPGLIFNELRTAYDMGAKRMWVANVHDPKVAAYGLSLFMDMAWNIEYVHANTVQEHLLAWLKQQFGKEAGEQLLPAMTEFYRLTGNRRPEFMGWSQVELDKQLYKQGLSPAGNTEFSALAFGNEIERYLGDYQKVKKIVDKVEKTIRPELKDAFFAAIKYPVYGAAAMAVKQLEAQEARSLARPQSFHIDDEALESAARSINAYREIQQLTAYYNQKMSGGKWHNSMSMAPRALPVFGDPTLPDQLSEEEIQKYGAPDKYPTKLKPEISIVKNACDYASATKGSTPIEMLGHSMKAISLPKNGQLDYTFNIDKRGEAILRVAVIPTHSTDRGDIRFSVSIDGNEPQVFSLKEPYRSEGWKQQVMRGQAVRAMRVYLGWGTHTLSIKALDPHIIVDQWMIDYDAERKFYLFPILPALR